MNSSFHPAADALKRWPKIDMPVQTYMCPCCGFPGLESKPFERLPEPPWSNGFAAPPYEQHYGLPSYEVCGCCGFEFGNDDNPGTCLPESFESYRAEWIADGCKWFDEAARPANWATEEQLVVLSRTANTKNGQQAVDGNLH